MEEDLRQPQTVLERTVQNASEFQQTLEEFAVELGERERKKGLVRPDNDLRPKVWYRGQANEKHVLLPSLHRAAHALAHESDVFDMYLRLGGASFGDDEWTTLFKMQHSGVPTRLLDWTENHYIALYFALREPERDRPVLYLLSPALLNYCHGLHDSVGATRLRNLHPSYPGYLDTMRSQPSADVDGPIAVLPILGFPRIIAQRGCFTLHGRCPDPIERQCPESVARIVLADTAAEALWPILGVVDSVVFPDDEGRSLHIRKVFGLDHPTDWLLAHYLRDRWREDLKDTPSGWDPLFPGLRGCVLADKYIPISVSQGSPTLEDWFARRTQGNRRTCFVLGGAGAGKTNYILNTIRDLYYPASGVSPEALARMNSKSEIVLWCALGQMLLGQEILAAVAAVLARLKQSLPFALNANTVRSLCRAQPTVLVLDGLDELARTRGNEEARRVIRDAARELHNSRKLRAIVGCRSHIYRNMVRGWIRDFGDVDEICLSGLCEDAVAQRLHIERSTNACRVACEVPLFLAAADRLSLSPTDLRDVSNEAEIRSLILKTATTGRRGQVGGYEEEMRKLGRVAALMIDKRKDYLSDEDFADHHEEERVVQAYAKGSEKGPEWPLFVRESEKEWRFIHQSIREYLLAWNMFDGFTNPSNPKSLVNRSSSLDFESAEVYCFLYELVAADTAKRFEKGACCCLEKWGDYNQLDWNRRMRNLFEAVGMLGVGCSNDLRWETLHRAIEIIERPQGEGHPYANFVTVYNAARCVERLHWSSPKSYCYYRRGGRREGEVNEPEDTFLKLDAYAVRGFNRKSQAVAIETPMPLRGPQSRVGLGCIHGEGANDDLEMKTVQCLKNALKRLIDQPELDEYQGFVAANLSHAIIRWLPFDGEAKTEAVAWLRDQWTEAKEKRFSRVASNLELALFWRGEAQYARRTFGNRIVALSDIPRTSLLQALVTDIKIERREDACQLDLTAPNDSECIWTSSQKDAFIRQTTDKRASDMKALQKEIDDVLIDRTTNSIELGKKLVVKHVKLRFASGGTLPILDIDGTEYYCLFYREIAPIGWNIANGGSADWAEIQDPSLTIQREFAEELVILDKTKVCRYRLPETSTARENPESVARLLDRLGLTCDGGQWKNVPLSPKVVPGRDQISINGKDPLREVYLNINMEDLGIEVDQVVRIPRLDRSISLLDGETEGGHSVHTATPGFINAPVGLFRVEQPMAPHLDGEFIPDVLFRNGERKCGEFGVLESNGGDAHRRRVTEVVNEFARERLEPLPSDRWDVYLKARSEKRAFVLCPATRTLLRQYLCQVQSQK